MTDWTSSRRRVEAVIRRLTREPVSDLDAMLIRALARVVRHRSVEKRFIRDIQNETMLTEKQRKFLWRIGWRYRRHLHETLWHAARERREWSAYRNDDVKHLTAEETTNGDCA